MGVDGSLRTDNKVDPHNIDNMLSIKGNDIPLPDTTPIAVYFRKRA